MSKPKKQTSRTEAAPDKSIEAADAINKLALEARLLALNAAIEAAKAGEAENDAVKRAEELRSISLGCAVAASDIARATKKIS